MKDGRIRTVSLFRLSLPLRAPYRLAYGAVRSLETIWARVDLDDGSSGWGESTPLSGYDSATIGDTWTCMQHAARRWAGRPAGEALSTSLTESSDVKMSALLTALEESLYESGEGEIRVPIVAGLDPQDTPSTLDSLREARNRGFRRFKVKIGFRDLEEDLAVIQDLQLGLVEGERIRIDANQSLDESAATRIASVCDPHLVEFLEQPLPAHMWEETARLARSCRVTILLDEAIRTIGDIRRAADSAAAGAVKLKWMKMGCGRILNEAVVEARRRGLGVVLGNGVASALNNAQEARFWAGSLADTGVAGEMNGFLRVRDPHGPPGIRLDGGWLVLRNRWGEPRIPPGAIQDREIIDAA